MQLRVLLPLDGIWERGLSAECIEKGTGSAVLATGPVAAGPSLPHAHQTKFFLRYVGGAGKTIKLIINVQKS